MKRSTRTGLPVVTGVLLACLVGCLVAMPGTGLAIEKEKARELLDGLRQRGYYDVALEYLDQISTSPRCPDDFKEVIDYETGVTLVAGLGRAGTLQMREKQLDDARDRFRKFLQEHAEHPIVASANTRLANVFVERGRMKMELADQPSKPAADKKSLRTEARTFFQEAHVVFEETERRAYLRAKSLQGVLDPKRDAARIEERDEARGQLLEAKLFLADTAHEIGKTYPQGSKEHKDHLSNAAGQYFKLFEDYGSTLGGLTARMLEGRIHKELGQPEKAIDVMKEMLTLPDAPERYRLLKNQSLVLLLELYILSDTKQYPAAIGQVEAWTEEARGAEESSVEGLAIHYLGGLASLEYAESLKPKDPDRKLLRVAARRHFDFVARFPGEYQPDARAKLLSLSGETDAELPKPTNYVEAKQRADFAWGTMAAALGKIQNAPDQTTRDKATRQMNSARDDAIVYYRMALDLSTPEILIDDLNLIRYNLTSLYWIARDYYRSAILGEFLARRYPESKGGRKGSEIAIKAYRNLFLEAIGRSEDTSFATEHMQSLANYITTRWPNQPEAQEAWMMLLDTAVDNRELDTALDHLEKIAPESPLRGQAELRAGLALWTAYVVGSATEGDQRPDQAELDLLLQKAQDTLEEGVQRMLEAVKAGEPPSYTLAYSALTLAQIHVGAGQSTEAVRWLDDPKIGPVTLVKANHPSIRGKGQFAEDTYKTALRAYVGAQKLDQAEATMAALEKLVAAAGDAKADQHLTRIYIQLGRELQEQVARLRSSGKTARMSQVSEGFEVFLKKISDREEGNNFSSLNWVAETFFGLGAGMDPGGKEISDVAQQHYKNAATTYVTIIKRAREDSTFAPPDADISVKVRLAACYRAIEQHETAMKILVSVLRSREKRIDVQIEAARTYQDWGQYRPGYYEYAIRGGHEENGRYLVWGWGGIASRLAPLIDKYESLYHEARYNLAFCRVKLALTQSADEKTKTLKKAQLDIRRVYQLYPTMGGPEWFKKYDTLLKAVQQILKEKPTGLKGG